MTHIFSFHNNSQVHIGVDRTVELKSASGREGADRARTAGIDLHILDFRRARLYARFGRLVHPCPI